MITNLLDITKPDQVSIISIEDTYSKIKEDFDLQQQCSIIRMANRQYKKTGDMSDYNEKERLKTKLPAFIPAGEFSYRSNKSLTRYHGQIVIDIDKIDNPDGLRAKIKSLKEPSVLLAFLSPSGNGLKVIHQLDVPELESIEETADFHKQAFFTLISYYKKKYKVTQIDKSGTDLARLCYYSHDPYAYYNPDAKGWKIAYIRKNVSSEPVLHSNIEGYYLRFSNDDENTNYKLVQNIIQWCGSNNISLLDHYHDWLRVMFVLKNTFSNEKHGLDLFLQLSSFSYKYNMESCIKKWQENTPNNINNKVTMGTLLYLAKLNGWRPSKNFHLGRRTILNCNVTALEENDIRLKYNELTHQLYYSESNDSEVWELGNDYIEGKIRLDILEMSMRREEFDSFFKYIPKKFNPVKEFLTSLPGWDGIDRFGELTSTLEIKNRNDAEISRKLLRRWLIGVINGLHNNPENEDNPSVSPNENLLILIGAQGIGKTRWIRKLMPDKWYSLFAEKPNMNFDDKDDKLLSCEKVIIAMDEMSPWLNNKTSNEQLKSFLSQKTFNIRVAYGRYNSVFYKIASIIGTSNHNEIITDPTGSRRFWPIEIESANYNHSVDMAQLWAQTYQLWKNGEQHWLSNEEQAELSKYNEAFTKIHPYEEYIARFIDHGDGQYTATQIAEFINDCLKDTNAVNPRQLGVYLKKAGYNNKSCWIGNKTQRIYEVTLLPEDVMDDFRKMEEKQRRKIKNWKKEETEKESIQAEILPDAKELF
jgi:hypothetical protein